MIIYNITYAVPHLIREAWLEWMYTEHIPEILATGCFQRHNLLQLMEVDESEFRTYALQFHAKEESDYRNYLQQFAKQLRSRAADKWGEQVIGFRTLMSVLQ
ncbi:MAG: hypothetical protein RLZZ172_386 [Bacteroidota bacterium]|jgi:hypothetical protein